MHVRSVLRRSISANPPATDIASRIMRRHNYLIALINKNLLDLRVPLPFFSNTGQITQTLEFNLMHVMHVMLDAQMHVKQDREFSAARLKAHFVWLGVVNLILAPFIIVYLFIDFSFRYLEVRRVVVCFVRPVCAYSHDPCAVGVPCLARLDGRPHMVAAGALEVPRVQRAAARV